MKKIFNKSKIRVSRTAVIIWRIDLTLLMLPVALLIMLIGVFFPVIAAIIGIAAAAAYILAIIFYIPLYCRNLNYTFDKKIITVKKGYCTKEPLCCLFHRCSTALLCRDCCKSVSDDAASF